jgi:hypothetical protein
MVVLIPRIRTINVRLSEDEYLSLERYCAASGARSISDLVRSTMNSVVTGGDQEKALALSVSGFDAHVKDLERRVEVLAAELESFRAGARPRGAGTLDEKTETARRQLLADAEDSSESAIVEQLLRETDI